MQRQIEAAGAYEALFVPALFRQYASKVADAANVVKVIEYWMSRVALAYLRENV